MRARVWIALLLSSQVAVAQPSKVAPKTEPDALGLPAPESGSLDASAILPPVPSFELPPSEPGFTTPHALRVAGTKLLDTDVKVKGYIIWIYNCIDDNRRT